MFRYAPLVVSRANAFSVHGVENGPRPIDLPVTPAPARTTRGSHAPGRRTFDTPPTFIQPEPRTQPGADRFENAVDLILDECFFAFGQAIGTRKTLEPDTVVWLREHYRHKFLRAMSVFGNRWQTDRARVMQVGHLLGRRSLRYANLLETIDRDWGLFAAADVERFCTLHAMRCSRDGSRGDEKVTPLIAGYWCVPGGTDGLGGTIGGD